MEGSFQKRKSISKTSKDQKQVKFVEKQTIINSNEKNIKKKVSKYYQSSRLVQKAKQSSVYNTQDRISIIHQSFNMFFCKKLDFNQFVAALKFIGVSIENEEDFQKMFYIFNENNEEMTISRYISIAVRILNEQQQKKLTCQQISLKKAYYYILEQGNQLNRFSNIYQNVKDFNQQQEVLNDYKKQVQKLPKQSRFISLQTLKNIRNYLNRKDISDKDLQDIFSYQDKGDQTYITYQNLLSMINYNKIA